MRHHFANLLLPKDKYKYHPEAVIVSCYFNPQNSPYRIKAFDIWYNSIKHLNHRIIECVIGDSKPQLPENENISRVYTKNLLWHKEALLNKIISELPDKFKYVCWCDTDILFTNKNWLVDSVKELQTHNIIQPFEYCIHLDKDELKPSFDIEEAKKRVFTIRDEKQIWRSACANYKTTNLSDHVNYNLHGHVGMVYMIRRSILNNISLYDKNLIGGFDHLSFHAACGHINHNCIQKSFTDDLDELNEWSNKFYNQIQGLVSYTPGTIYHIWHGDLEKRQYLKRIQDFTKKSKTITKKDINGLYVTENGDDDSYMLEYFKIREVSN